MSKRIMAVVEAVDNGFVVGYEDKGQRTYVFTDIKDALECAGEFVTRQSVEQDEEKHALVEELDEAING